MEVWECGSAGHSHTPTPPHSHTPPEILRWSAATVAENLAIDEDLARQAGRDGRRTLRLWWGGPPTVVLGRSERAEVAADLEACRRLGVGVLQRVTGGGAVLQTSGVFNYSLTVPDSGRLDIHDTFRRGAGLIVRTLAHLGVAAHLRGVSDVAVGERKISGNAQARKWRSVLLHGTLLVQMDLELLEAVLPHPLREPDYRDGRRHRDFLVTLADLGIEASRRAVEEACVLAAGELALNT